MDMPIAWIQGNVCQLTGLRGFSCTNRNGNTCIATVTTGTQTAVTTAMCSGAQVVSRALETFPDIITITATATSSGKAAALQTVTREMVLWAPMFQLNFRPTDLGLTSSTASRTTTTPTLAPNAKSSATSPSSSSNTVTAPDPSSSGSSNQSGLSTGAIAGIAVGAALGGILLGAAAILLILRHRRGRTTTVTPLSPPPPPPQLQEPGRVWTATGDSGPYNYKYATGPPPPGYVVTEMAADQDRFEMFGERTPVELAAGTAGVRHVRN